MTSCIGLVAVAEQTAGTSALTKEYEVDGYLGCASICAKTSHQSRSRFLSLIRAVTAPLQ
jgi:hypothetical protein